MYKADNSERRSLFDVIETNLELAGCNVYITRVIFIGEYFDIPPVLQEKMQEFIDELKQDYADVLVTGLLLSYPRYYVHLLEGSEDIIYKFFKFICRKNDRNIFGRAVLLPAYHHVYKRFFPDWFKVYTVPPALLDKLESQTLMEIQKHMYTCFIKIYGLCGYLIETFRDKSQDIKDTLQNLDKNVPYYLPESTVLEFLLKVKSPVIKSVEDYLRMYVDVPFINLYNDTIWPPPTDFMPQNVLKKYDQEMKKHR